MVVTLNGKRYDIPGCYEELKVKHYRQILNWETDKPIHERNFFKLFCILSETQFTEFKASAENEQTIWNCVRWIIEQPFQFSNDVPKVLQIGDKIVSIPKNLGSLSIGQNIIMRQILESAKAYMDKDGKVYDYDCYDKAVAIYLQPLVDESKFDWDKAQELAKVIDEMPIYLIRPIGFFLLGRAIEDGKRQTRNLRQTQSSRILNLKGMLPNWRWLGSLGSGKSFTISGSTLRYTDAIQTMYFMTQVLIR
jgi:hypothetical protein